MTAALYLARYRLSVTVFDDGTSRAASIPVSRNHAGFPDGIKGSDLLARMSVQATNYGAEIRHQRVLKLHAGDDDYVVAFDEGTLSARTILIATGVKNRVPSMSKDMHDAALRRGLIRYCPVCDGFEVTDKRVAVVGQGSKAFKEALFLRSYSRDITLVSPSGQHHLQSAEVDQLREVGISIENGPIQFEVKDDAMMIRTLTGAHKFDSIYPALGSHIRSELAMDVGATLSPEGCIRVDNHQRTDVQGLYAAGDVVIGLDQISHAMGQAGVAATTIRNDLANLSPLLN